MEAQIEEILLRIVAAIRKAGYDPYAQLWGYLGSSDPRYITRRDNARMLIRQIDRSVLLEYVSRMGQN